MKRNSLFKPTLLLIMGTISTLNIAYGQSATAPIAKPSLVFEEKNGIVAVEAEHFISQEKDNIRAWYRVEEGAVPNIQPDPDGVHLLNTSGASYLEALPDSRSQHEHKITDGENFFSEAGSAGVLTYNVYFNNPGRYYVWVRHFSTGSEDNGLHVGIDGTWPESGKRWQTIKKRTWAWESRQRTDTMHVGEKYKLYLDVATKGLHQIHFSMREDGFEFDKFVLAASKEFEPEGFGPETKVQQGKLPAPKSLSADFQEESYEKENLGPLVPLPAGTARLAAPEFDITGSNFYVNYDKWLAIDPTKHKTAVATAISPVGNDSYIVIFHAVGEHYGRNNFKIKLANKELGEFSSPLSKSTFDEGLKYTAIFKDVYINEGEYFKITSEISSVDGIEYSRGRWVGLTLLPKDATPEQIQSARRSFEDKYQRANAVSLTVDGELKQWHKVTIQFQGPQADEADTKINPFMDYRFDVEVTHSSGSPTYVIPGYFAADGNAANTSATSGNIWRAHFSPDKTGDWRYKTSFLTGPGVAIGDNGGIPVEEYHAIEGTFTIAPNDKTGRDFRAHGRLQYVNKHHLKFAGSNKYFLKAGPDAPETLLAYTDFDNTETRLPKKGPLKTWSPHLQDWNDGDPTWQDGKGKALIGALNYLASKGMNAFSFLTYNAGGDGDNVWPYIDRDKKRHFDVSKLAQWGVVFDHAQANGLYLHFKLQENESDDNRFGPRKIPQLIPEALDGGATGPERKVYLREIIARFGYHLALNWNIGEENTQSNKEQDDMAEYIREIDPYDHLLVIHTFPSQQDPIYNRLLDDRSIIRSASTQNKWDAAHQFTLRWIERSAKLGTPWVVPNDEQNPAGAGVPPDPGYKGFNGLSGDKLGNYDLHGIRKHTLWGNLMAGGAGVEYYFGYWLPETDLNAQDWRSRDRSWDYARIAIEFFQNNNIPFWEMKTNNALVANPENKNDRYAFVKPGDTYVVYLPNGGSVALDLTGETGEYEVKWYDPRNGGKLLTSNVKTVRAGTTVSLGIAPNNVSEDWAILVRKR